MSAKAIREYDGKLLLAENLFTVPTLCADQTRRETSSGEFLFPKTHLAQVRFELPKVNSKEALDAAIRQELERVEVYNPWLKTTKLVVKPDQLIKRRGKSGLLLINQDWSDVKNWIAERAFKEIKIGAVSGVIKVFVIEPFLPHTASEEYYVCIQTHREGDEILFTHEGGVDIGDVDSKATRCFIPVNGDFPEKKELTEKLFGAVDTESKKAALYGFVERLYAVFVRLNFTYLEINPLVVMEREGKGVEVVPLDMAAKLDQTAEFESGSLWASSRMTEEFKARSVKTAFGGPPMEFPAPFGRELTPEEAYVQELDSKTGASLKLTILNPKGRVWTMVAGGGASVVYADAIAAYGCAAELANYGEYSGAPSENQTYEYAKTILELMTRERHADGKVLIIGGGIANFTNVATTFKGIIRALKELKTQLISNDIKIYVRRAGPNWQEGLRMMRELGDVLGVEIRVFGPETHITAIVPLALGKKSASVVDFRDNLRKQIPDTPAPGTPIEDSLSGFQTPLSGSAKIDSKAPSMTKLVQPVVEASPGSWYAPFDSNTRSIVFGMQPRAVQGMLDFDFICKRSRPSVACIVYPFSGNHVQKFYWGTQETLLPVFSSLSEAIKRSPDVSVAVNFASCRSVYETTMEMMTYDNIKCIAIIAEGVPERRARQLLCEANKRNLLLIGPATVGGIKPGCFKIGNTGGMMDNIASSKLYFPGSVAYVSKSGGMSNELNNIISRTTDGVYEGVAIGGDRYPGSTFLDHLLRYEADPNVKLMVLLGEVGGVEEYRVAEAVKSKKLTKPIVAWCIGTCAKMFGAEVQFGHAGALANTDLETAEAKNAGLR
ncbi:ATP-citrate synthase, partial [Zancudomyces culisetae]